MAIEDGYSVDKSLCASYRMEMWEDDVEIWMENLLGWRDAKKSCSNYFYVCNRISIEKNNGQLRPNHRTRA